MVHIASASSIGVLALVATMWLPLVGLAEPPVSPASVILIIGDGMDDNQVTIARNYLVGARGRLGLDAMPVRSAVQVLTVAEDDPQRPVYVADSANSATAIASGVVTSRGRLGTAAGTDEDVATIVELARDAGLATGLVTTSSITDATPAAFAAHVRRRSCESPESMAPDPEFLGGARGGCPDDLLANGGLGSVSEQLAGSNVDVLLGGGADEFAPAVEGGTETVRQRAEANGYVVVSDAAGLAAAPIDRKILGLFAAGHLPPRWRGEDGREADKPDPSWLNEISSFLGSVELPEPMRCEPNPEFGDTPDLAALTRAALERLTRDPERGFFLMIESASVDKESHRRRACGAIGEMEQLEEALAVALEAALPETLVIVTADHGHAAQIVPEESLFTKYGVPIYTPGHLVRVVTHDGAVMSINYATNDFYAEEHTGVQVPLYANEVARDEIATMIDQPDLFEIMRRHLGL